MSLLRRSAAFALACTLVLAVGASGAIGKAPPRTATLIAVGDIASCTSDGDEQTAALVSKLPARSRCSATSRTTTAPLRTSRTASTRAGGRSCRASTPRSGTTSTTWHGHCRDRSLPAAAQRVVQLRARRLARHRAELELRKVGGCGEGHRSGAGSGPISPPPNRCTLAYWHHPRFSSAPTARTPPTPVLGSPSRRGPMSSCRVTITTTSASRRSGGSAPSSSAGRQEPLPDSRPGPGSVIRNSSTYGVLRLALRPTGYGWTFLPFRPGGTFTRRRLGEVAARTTFTPRRLLLTTAGANLGSGNGSARSDERLLHDSKHLRATALLDRRKTRELEPTEIDPTLGAHGDEAEILEEVAREDRTVNEKPLAPSSRSPDTRYANASSAFAPGRAPPRSRPETVISRPTRRPLRSGTQQQTRTASSDGGPAGRSAARGKKPGGPVLHRSEHRAVVVIVDRPPLTPDSSSTRSIQRSFFHAVLLPRDCHHTQSRQTDGAVAIVPRVSPATRDGTGLRSLPVAGRCRPRSHPPSPAGRSAIRPRYSATLSCTALPTAGALTPQSTAR